MTTRHFLRRSRTWRTAFGEKKDKLKLGYHTAPISGGPANRHHTTVFPDQFWASPRYPLHHIPANGALETRGEDATSHIVA